MRGVRGPWDTPLLFHCFVHFRLQDVKFTNELRVIELLRLTTMKILLNAMPPFRNSQSRQTRIGRELISFCSCKTPLKISHPL